MSGIQGIRTGLQTQLTTCWPWSAGEVSASDFGILETASACAIVFLPGQNTRIDPLTRGTYNSITQRRDWDISGHLYIKYTGNATCLLAMVWQGHDDLYDTIKKDNSLQGALAANGAAWLYRFSFDENRSVQAHGHKWADILWGVTAVEL